MAWHDHQIWRVGDYRRMAKLTDTEYRTLLHSLTGRSSSKDPELTQAEFDVFMAGMEQVLEYRTQEGFCKAPPPRIDIQYWRRRMAQNGEANRRMLHKVYDLWNELQPMLPAEARNKKYLYAIASRTCRKPVEHISDLKGWQVHQVIEALKERVFQTRRTLAQERAGLPGADPRPIAPDPIVPTMSDTRADFPPDQEIAPDQPETTYHPINEDITYDVPF